MKYDKKYFDEVECKVCRKLFVRLKKRKHGTHKLRRGTRSVNCVTCSRECSKKYLLILRKEYSQRPEVKIKRKEYHKKYWQRLEVKIKKKEDVRKKYNIPKEKWRVR